MQSCSSIGNTVVLPAMDYLCVNTMASCDCDGNDQDSKAIARGHSRAEVVYEGCGVEEAVNAAWVEAAGIAALVEAAGIASLVQAVEGEAASSVVAEAAFWVKAAEAAGAASLVAGLYRTLVRRLVESSTASESHLLTTKPTVKRSTGKTQKANRQPKRRKVHHIYSESKGIKQSATEYLSVTGRRHETAFQRQ